MARDLLFVHFPQGLRIFGIILPFALPVIAALIFQRTLARLDDATQREPASYINAAVADRSESA